MIRFFSPGKQCKWKRIILLLLQWLTLSRRFRKALSLEMAVGMSPLNPQIKPSHGNGSIKHLIFSSSDWAAKRAAPIYFYWRRVYLERIPPGSRDSNWCKIGWLRQTASVCHCLIISRPTSGSHIYLREREEETNKKKGWLTDYLAEVPGSGLPLSTLTHQQ